MQRNDGGAGRGNRRSGNGARRWRFLLLVMIACAAFLFRFRGIDWPRCHPDEHAIASWIRKGKPDRTYPEGFFVLSKPVAGAVDALCRTTQRIRYFAGTVDRLSDEEHGALDYIMFARGFNLTLGVLTCLIVYPLTRNVTQSPSASLLATALLSFSMIHIDHCHCGETDVAMVFTQTLGLWLWSHWIVSGRRLWFALTAVVLGFAAGTKFTLVMVFPAFAVQCILYPTAAQAPRNAKARALYFAAGIVLFALGLRLANPQMRHWADFLAGLRHEKTRLVEETVRNMGALAGHSFVRYRNHLRSFATFSSWLGYPWTALAAAGLPLACSGRYRRFWAILILFPLSYTAYWVFLAPWVRSQEFMNYLPAFSVFAALTVLSLWRSRNPAARILAVAMVPASLLWAAHYSLRSTSVFEWEDSRRLAERWLKRHVPAGARFAKEQYVDTIDTLGPAHSMYVVEQIGTQALLHWGTDYVLRRGSVGGRGLRNPLTGNLYPFYAGRHREFLNHSEEVCTWGTLPPSNPKPGFNSWTIRLLGMRSFPRGPDLDVWLPKPLLLSEEGRMTYFPNLGALGSMQGSLVDRYPRRMAIGGPEDLPPEVYVIVNTVERSAEAIVKGLRTKRRKRLAPYDVAVIRLQRPIWPPLSSFWAMVDVRTAPVKHILYIPCFARLAFTRADVLRVLLDLGRKDRLREFLASVDPESGISAPLLYQAAVQCGEWGTARTLALAAAREMSRIRQACEVEQAPSRLRGVSTYYYDQFARLRLGLEAVSEVAVTQPGSGKDSDRFLGTLDLAARIAGGRYTLKGKAVGAATDPEAELGIFNCRSGKRVGRLCFSPETQQCVLSLHVEATQEEPLQLLLKSDAPLRVHFEDLVLHWSFASMMDDEMARYELCRARHLVHDGDYPAAVSLLSVLLERSPPGPDDVRVHRLLFEAYRGMDPYSEECRRSARSLVNLAPRHHGALHVLGTRAPENVETDAGISAETPERSVVFEPFLRLTACAHAPECHHLSLEFEALEDYIPSLAVSLHTKKRGRWRRALTLELPRSLRLLRGERTRLNFVLPPRLSKLAGDELKIGVYSSVRWFPGRLTIADQQDALLGITRAKTKLARKRH